MRACILEAFFDFTKRFESVVPWMYLDVKGLVTTGNGNLIDPMPYAESLPWENADKSRATLAQIRAAWCSVKGRQDLAKLGGGAFAALTALRLSAEAIRALVNARLLKNAAILKGRFAEFDTWPADAQLATLSMAWAAGADFAFPNFEAAVRKSPPDFETARLECHLSEVDNQGVRPRNIANASLFSVASLAVTGQANPNILHLTDVFRGS